MPDFIKMPEPEYHANPAIGSSRLREFAESPLAAKMRKPVPANEGMIRGSVGHMLVWEPERNDILISAYKTVCKSLREEQDEAGPGKLVVTQSAYDDGQRCRDAVMLNHRTAELVNLCVEREVSGFWTDPTTGLECKLRFDGLARDLPLGVDLKTSDNFSNFYRGSLSKTWLAGEPTLGRCVTQAGHYTSGAKVITGQDYDFALILVVLNPVPEATVIYLTKQTLEAGADWCRMQLQSWKRCMDGDKPWAAPWAQHDQEYDIESGLGARIMFGGKAANL